MQFAFYYACYVLVQVMLRRQDESCFSTVKMMSTKKEKTFYAKLKMSVSVSFSETNRQQRRLKQSHNKTVHTTNVLLFPFTALFINVIAKYIRGVMVHVLGLDHLQHNYLFHFIYLLHFFNFKCYLKRNLFMLHFGQEKTNKQTKRNSECS